MSDSDRHTADLVAGEATDSRPERIERTYAVLRDGSKRLLSTRIYPTNPIPGVVYDDKGLPAPYTTAIRNRRLTLEQLDTDLQLSRKKGGHAPKNLPGLQAAVDRLAAEHPAATAKELWNLVPEVEGDTIEGFIVYRDGSEVVQVEDKTGREKALSFRSFCRYVTAARKKVPRTERAPRRK